MFDDDKYGPAFAWAGAGSGGPRHHHGHHRGRHHEGPDLGAMFRFFWSNFGPGGPGGRRGPNMYGRGDLKFVLLELLQERPKHGYEMIKELESRAGGFYTPSAGAVYPTLQLLEDRGWVTSATQDGKKVYTITSEGRNALEERRAQQERPGPREHGPHGHGPGPHEHEHEHGPWGHHRGRHSPFGGFAGPELEALGRDSIEVARLMRDAVIAARGDPAKLEKIRSIVQQTRQALSALLQQDDSPSSAQRPEPPPEMV